MLPRILVLRAPGTNCDVETAFAFQHAGGSPEILHVRRILESPRKLDEFQVLCIPGGFSYGDDIASGRIFGIQLQNHLADALRQFQAAGKLILGICNGFQVLVKCGLLAPVDPTRGPSATLAWNVSGKFEARWVRLVVTGTKCVFLSGIEKMYIPVKHGEGRFVARDEKTMQELEGQGQLILRYAPLDVRNDQAAAQDTSVPYPDNPNGTQANIAGICDVTGRVFGLMPHPELHVDPLQHPRWTRGEAGQTGDGLRLFQNAVGFFR